jgi:DNA polymerase-3 subunit delta'
MLRHLENAARNGRLSHAFLLHADSERARQEFATILAQIASCPESKAGRTCGVCRVCRQIENRSYPEFYTLTPVGKKFMIRVGDRDNPEPNTLLFFEKQFHLTGISGGQRKVGVIFDADRMNEESQNALLKTLEEPPPETLLILATGNPGALLPTTKSRCQLLPLLTNQCQYNFPGADELIKALNTLISEARGDLALAEEQASAICKAATDLNADATEKNTAEWEDRLNAALKIGDSSYTKRLEAQALDAGYGAYQKERGLFLSAIHTFASELFLLADGVPFEKLPNPELFPGGTPKQLTPELGEMVLKEAEELLFTLRFNVTEELALRSFAVNIAMK